MKRRLIVMRHAKSSWKVAGQPDHERALNKRGRRDAPRIGAELARLGWIPERVVSSDAQRTRETYVGLCVGWEAEPSVTFSSELYLAGLSEVRQVLGELVPQEGSLLVLGHNPGWEDMASSLSGQAIGMTTANAVCLSGEGATWVEALSGPWALEHLLRPKELD